MLDNRVKGKEMFVENKISGNEEEFGDDILYFVAFDARWIANKNINSCSGMKFWAIR